MTEIESRTSLGGQVNDTNNGSYIREVYADGVYAWSPLESEEIDERLSELENELDEITEVDHLELVRNILIF